MPTVQLRDILTYYEEAGSGDPLMLLGGLGSDLQSWANVVPQLSGNFRVIAVDQRGAGRTSAPDRPYSIAGMAEDVAALMDQIGVEKAHVAGFGMGALVALELAGTKPDRVQKLVLGSAALAYDVFAREVVKSWAAVRRSNVSREAAQRLLATWLYSDELFSEDRFERAMTNAATNPYAQQDHAFIRQAEAVLEYDGTAVAGDVKAETLVLRGTDDRLLAAELAEALSKALPSATLTELPGGHAGVLEHAKEYGETISEFLAAE